MNIDNQERFFGGMKMTEKKDVHRLTLEERKSLLITGVRKVKSFDTKEIILETTKGGLIIKGSELGITNLNLDHSEIEIEGQIDILSYSGNRARDSKGMWERLFK